MIPVFDVAQSALILQTVLATKLKESDNYALFSVVLRRPLRFMRFVRLNPLRVRQLSSILSL